MTSASRPPAWADAILDRSVLPTDQADLWSEGILKADMIDSDPTIEWYTSQGGAHFQDRMQLPFTMTSLDTPLYHEILAGERPADADAVVIDVGAGDGRNTLPFLKWGCRRVVAVEPVRAALVRLRQRALQEFPDAAERLLLVQADARRLPLCADAAELVVAVEALCCLNEDHHMGLAECSRILRPGRRMVLAERAWEGSLLLSLLYGGVAELLRLGEGRSLWDGPPDNLVRTRVFTESELRTAVRAVGLTTVASCGLSVLSVVCGYLRGAGRLHETDVQQFPAVLHLLRKLCQDGQARRSHILICTKTAMPK